MNMPRTLSLGAGRTQLIIQKNAPHILFAAGVIGGVVSTYLACRATLKVSDTLDEIKENVNNVENIKTSVPNYSETDRRKDLAYVYTRGGLELVKLYGPAVLVGTLSITALTGSHVQLSRRNTALMAAYAALQEAYYNYRARVREEIGEERELAIYQAHETKTIEGKKVKTWDPNRHSMYAVFFDEYSPNWEKDPELNRLFIQCQQTYANNLLKSRGHVFLNEIYDMLGVNRTKAGAVVGWVIGHDGDNFIDFGIFEPENSRFVNGIERSILLDFNVDGVIYDKI